MAIAADKLDQYQAAQRVTIIGSILDLALGVVKIIIGFIGHSNALIVDGIHSLSDVASDIVILVVSRFTYSNADDDHPYGHQRFETLGTIVLGTVLVFISGAFAYDSIIRLFTRQPVEVPEWTTLVVAAISVVSKEWIYRYTRKVGEQINSKLIVANAWHSRTDAFSSIVVLVGVGSAMLGWLWADLTAAFAMSLYIAYIGMKFVNASAKELVDASALTPEEQQTMINTMRAVPGVLNVHDIRSRSMGPEVFIDVHICVSDKISVSEGHQIGAIMEARVKEEFPQVKDVVFHIDTQMDDSQHEHHTGMPLREDVINTLLERWEDCSYLPTNDRILLHYGDHGISAEIFAPLSILQDQPNQAHKYHKELSAKTDDLPWLSEIEVWYGEHLKRI